MWKGEAMHSTVEDNLMAFRQEILDLLRQQLDVLNSPLGLTDDQLRECYLRQTRVQELREQLQMALSVQQLEAGPMETAQTLIPSAQPTSAEQCV
jgi:hypothetical protein